MMIFLHHSGIIKFIEDLETNTHLYIITELIVEGDLLEYINKKSLLDGISIF